MEECIAKLFQFLDCEKLYVAFSDLAHFVFLAWVRAL
jgi:hypothetical protein